MLIREAHGDDWVHIWPIFRQVVRAQETYAFDPDMGEELARSIWMEQPPGATVAAVDETSGEVLGTAKMGPNRAGPGAHVGTASFMVDEAARGRGVGRALAEHVVAWHRDNGYRSIQFNAVVETNHSAVELWRALGFRVIGTVPEAFAHPEHGLVGLHVMYLPLEDR